MKILVCVDSSVFADEMIREIARRSWQESTAFRLVTAVERGAAWESEEHLLNLAENILEPRVRLLKERLDEKLSVSGDVLEGTAAEVIIDEARLWGADLIMIGSHGDTGIRKSGIGSVAAAVVNDAPCSVEVVKLKSAVAGRLPLEAACKGADRPD